MINIHEISDALSLERFSRYLAWAGGDEAAALEFYALNTLLSEALYTPLHMLEVCLRNRIHTEMAQHSHVTWFNDHGFLQVARQREQLEKAYKDLTAKDRDPTPGDIVATLTFSFWTSMISPSYQDLWQARLNRIARTRDGKGLKRSQLADPLGRIRLLRNRIAHHEPILHWNLPKHYAAIVEITGWLSPAAAAWCQSYSRFEEVYPPERIILQGASN